MRLALLGYGSIGRRHARNLAALGRNAITVFDPAPTARAAAQDAPGVEVAATLERVWDRDPEAVLVASPPDRHIVLALEAARRGCHVFIEKPLAPTLAGVEELCREIARRRLVSMVACNMRFHPGPVRVKALLDEGAIGRALAARVHTGSYLPDWRPGTDYRASYSASAAAGGGAVLDCIHEIDLALWYFGPATLLAAAVAPADSIGLEVEGLAEILLRHEAGTLTSVHLNFVQRDYRRGCEVIGSEGSLSWDFGRGAVERIAPDGRQTYLQPPDWELDAMYRDELAHFLRCVEDRSATVNPVASSLPALEIALAARAPGVVCAGEVKARP